MNCAFSFMVFLRGQGFHINPGGIVRYRRVRVEDWVITSPEVERAGAVLVRSIDRTEICWPESGV